MEAQGEWENEASGGERKAMRKGKHPPGDIREKSALSSGNLRPGGGGGKEKFLYVREISMVGERRWLSLWKRGGRG